MPLPLPYETAIDLSSLNWELKLSQSFFAIPNSDGSFNPIPEQALTVEFTSPVIAVVCTTLQQTNDLKVGFLLQTQQLGFGNTSVLTSRSLWLGTKTIFFRQDLEGVYKLRFKPRFKLSQVSILIYEFQP